MNKSRNIPLTDRREPKRTMTNFVRKVVRSESEDRSAENENRLNKNKESGWLQKPDDSWDY